MKILAIETSCDETAVAILETKGGFERLSFSILGNALYSQVPLHAPYGGVFPNLAKREHQKNLIPLLDQALIAADLKKGARKNMTEHLRAKLDIMLEREHDLKEAFLAYVSTVEKPSVDYIAVTSGPGLEPALWVGINFAKALSTAWNVPVIPVNHMEGHLCASLLVPSSEKTGVDFQLNNPAFPILALLVSGGHTELVLAREWGLYKLVGRTRDDAAGEAFDKAARLMGLPYPGGPAISRLAEAERAAPSGGVVPPLPRPMLTSPDFDFSFSGLKTAVRRTVEASPVHDDAYTAALAKEFEDAVVDVLIAKTVRAALHVGAQTIVIGGGVSANTCLKTRMRTTANRDLPGIPIYFPSPELSTDNAVMIGVAGAVRHITNTQTYLDDDLEKIIAEGNAELATNTI